jgi:hypothetical protein
MLKQSARKQCIWIVLALFSAIAALGDGLHFLPGLGHDCRETHNPLVTHLDCPKSDCVYENASADDNIHKRFGTVTVTHAGDECPLCQYFTQAQSVPLTVLFEIDSRMVERRNQAISPLLADHHAAAYSSRAPPSCR